MVKVFGRNACSKHTSLAALQKNVLFWTPRNFTALELQVVVHSYLRNQKLIRALTTTRLLLHETPFSVGRERLFERQRRNNSCNGL